jgi:hypothetical protein
VTVLGTQYAPGTYLTDPNIPGHVLTRMVNAGRINLVNLSFEDAQRLNEEFAAEQEQKAEAAAEARARGDTVSAQLAALAESVLLEAGEDDDEDDDEDDVFGDEDDDGDDPDPDPDDTDPIEDGADGDGQPDIAPDPDDTDRAGVDLAAGHEDTGPENPEPVTPPEPEAAMDVRPRVDGVAAIFLEVSPEPLDPTKSTSVWRGAHRAHGGDTAFIAFLRAAAEAMGLSGAGTAKDIHQRLIAARIVPVYEEKD